MSQVYAMIRTGWDPAGLRRDSESVFVFSNRPRRSSVGRRWVNGGWRWRRMPFFRRSGFQARPNNFQPFSSQEGRPIVGAVGKRRQAGVFGDQRRIAGGAAVRIAEPTVATRSLNVASSGGRRRFAYSARTGYKSICHTGCPSEHGSARRKLASSSRFEQRSRTRR